MQQNKLDPSSAFCSSDQRDCPLRQLLVHVVQFTCLRYQLIIAGFGGLQLHWYIALHVNEKTSCRRRLVHSQSLRGEAVVESLIPHWTGWSVLSSTVMLFPSTLGLSLIRFTTCPARQKCNIKHATKKVNNFLVIIYCLKCT